MQHVHCVWHLGFLELSVMMVLLIVQVDHLIGWLVICDWYRELVGMVRNQQHSEGCFLHSMLESEPDMWRCLFQL